MEYLLESTELLAKNGNILDNVLETLDIQQHSLGVLFVLVVKFSEPNVSIEICRIKIVFEILMYYLIFRTTTIPRTCYELFGSL